MAWDRSIIIPNSIAFFISLIPSGVSPSLVLFPEPYLFLAFHTGIILLNPNLYSSSSSSGSSGGGSSGGGSGGGGGSSW